MEKIVTALIIAGILSGVTAIGKVLVLEEKVKTQKEMIKDIDTNVKWMRNNWHTRK